MSNKKLTTSNSYNNLGLVSGSMSSRSNNSSYSPRLNHLQHGSSSGLSVQQQPKQTTIDYHTLPKSSLIRSESSAATNSHQRTQGIVRQPFLSPPASQRLNNMSNNNDSTLNASRNSPRMDEKDLKSVARRQQQQLEEQKQRRTILERKIASLNALNVNQTQKLLSDSRTKELKQQHMDLSKKIENLRIAQAEFNKLKKSHSKQVSQLSMAKAQAASQRTEMAPQIQRLNALLDILDRLQLCTNQAQSGAGFLVLQTSLQSISMLGNEIMSLDAGGRDLGILVFSSQMNKLLQSRQLLEVSINKSHLQETSSPNLLHISNNSSSGEMLPYSPRNLSSSLSQVPAKPDLSGVKLQPNQIVSTTPTINNRHKISLPSPMSDLSGTELLIRAASSSMKSPRDEASLSSSSSVILRQKPLQPPSLPPPSSSSSAPSSALYNQNFDTSDGPVSFYSNKEIQESNFVDPNSSSSVVAPRVMRRASLLRYASNSVIKDTYFRGSKRDELAKKYKESAAVLFQNRLSQIRLSPATFVKDTNVQSQQLIGTSLDNVNLPREILTPSDLDMIIDNDQPTISAATVSSSSNNNNNNITATSVNVTADSLDKNRYQDNDDDLRLYTEALLNDLNDKNHGGVMSASDESENNTGSQNTPEVSISKEPDEGGIQTMKDDNKSNKMNPDESLLSSAVDKMYPRSHAKTILRLRIDNATLPPASGRRIRFSPLTLLLDASLVGDLDMVQKVVSQMESVSEPNEDGITALHNSVCAGYDDISRFLVLQAFADVNAQELDGWTPLHCAAACGSVEMCRLLVENGAALLMPTLEDGETALEKATNLARESGSYSDGHTACEEYLHEQVMLLWRTSSGSSTTAATWSNNTSSPSLSTPPTTTAAASVLYAVFDYDAQQADELSLVKNEEIIVMQGDLATDPYWFKGRSLLQNKDGLLPKCFVSRFPLLLRSTNEE